jgi:hypothetical protein
MIPNEGGWCYGGVGLMTFDGIQKTKNAGF